VRRLAAGTQPNWSSDGRRIAFTNESSGRSAIYVVGSNGKGLKKLTHSHFSEYDPAWAPR
jgi:TolB protein